MDTLWGMVFLCCALWGIAIWGHEMKKKANRELYKSDPQALIRLEELENERLRMRNSSIHGGLKTGVGVTSLIIKAFTKR